MPNIPALIGIGPSTPPIGAFLGIIGYDGASPILGPGQGNVLESLPDGTVATPALNFTSEPSLGLFRSGAGQMNLTGRANNFQFIMGTAGQPVQLNAVGTDPNIYMYLAAKGTGYIQPMQSFVPTTNNNIDLGTVANNFRNLYAGNVSLGNQAIAVGVAACLVCNATVYTPPMGAAYNNFKILLFDGGTAAASFGIGIEASNIGFVSVGGFKFYKNNVNPPAMVITTVSGGQVGIGMLTPLTSPLQVANLPTYANNAAAVTGGLTVGAFYRTGQDPDVIAAVH